MGTWICHLRIAENLLTNWPDLDEAAFTFGNIAPDSGVPNTDWTAFDPPKEVTHFLKLGEDEGRVKDLDFYRGYLTDLAPQPDRAHYSFVLGYFCHLVCDNLWWKLIAKATMSIYAELYAQLGRAMFSDVKEDWYGLDQCYVRDHPDSLFWRVFLTAPYPPAYLPFIPNAALHHQFDYIRKFYSQPDPGWVLDRPYPYLNEATMDRFVDDATAAIVSIRARSVELEQLTDTHTALALLATHQVEPYAAPIGDDQWWR